MIFVNEVASQPTNAFADAVILNVYLYMGY